jgi:hypothetical protein
MLIGFILDKSLGTNCPKRVENAKILIANTRTFSVPMDLFTGSERRAYSHGYRQDKNLRRPYEG